MGIVELLLLAVSLAMDAFAVAVCGSMVLTPAKRIKGALRFGAWFGFFQALMPLLGHLCASCLQSYILNYDHWVAFGLLAYLGFEMITEADEECHMKESYTAKEMFFLAMATSIDALAVGISLAFLNVEIWYAAFIIGLVTFVIATIGGLIGFRLGRGAGQYANICGCIVLIGIGVKILLEQTLLS